MTFKHLSTGAEIFCLFLLWGFVSPLIAQESETGETRAGQIEAAREKKAQDLKPDVPNKWENILSKVKDDKWLERMTQGIAGFRVKFGGLASGAGFALGPEYFRQDFANGNLWLRTSAQASFQGATKMDFELYAPRLLNERAEWNFLAVRHNYPRMPYYGNGPDSEKTGRSNFRLEDMAIDTTFALNPVKKTRLGVSTGYLLVNTGPGTDSRFISADSQFDESTTPGIDHQANAFRYGAFAQLDYRDNPGGPRAGGAYLVQYNVYSDQELDRFNFSRLTVDLQQYIPIFNKRRTIALRARTNHSFVKDGNQVPFYLQSTLGGNNDLRGYRPYRFYGDNSMLMNAEWRWEVFSGMDMAIFADAGKVFQHHREMNFKDLESNVGFGARFNARNNTFIRFDVAFSHEGYQVWFAFGDAFPPSLQRTSSNRAFE